MSGCIHQIQQVCFTIVMLVIHRDRMALNGDAALALQIHRVEELGAHLAFIHRRCELKQPIRERGLPMIDVRDDAEIT